MDLFDVPFLPPGPDPPPGRNRAESVVAGVVVFVLPTLYLCLLTFTELTKRPDLAVLWGPAIVSLLGALVCVVARMSLGRAIVTVVGCLWWCLLAGLALVAIDILIFPF